MLFTITRSGCFPIIQVFMNCAKSFNYCFTGLVQQVKRKKLDKGVSPVDAIVYYVHGCRVRF